MKVKICGIKNTEDAIYSIDCGADAIGFVFHEPSSRYINEMRARDIIKSLPPFVQKVGLFTTQSPSQINDIMEISKLSLAQIHNHVDDDFIEQLNYPHIRVLRIKTKDELEQIKKDEYYIVDAFVDNFGGEGKKIDLSIFKNINCTNIILAGGLTSEYLSTLKDYDFYGIDVSSGVESSKGVKSHKKIRKFIEIAKSITRHNL